MATHVGGASRGRPAAASRNGTHTSARSKTLHHHQLGLDDQRALEMYRTMLLARMLDERQWVQQRQGKQAFHISCQGHEGSGAGSAFALVKGKDLLATYYRNLAAVLHFGVTARHVMLAALARAEDPATGGRMMAAHFSEPSLGILSSSSVVASQVPHAAGAALASKIRGDDAVAVAYFGDGATSKGDFHEGLNFAAIHKLPAIFICENNHFAISVPLEKQMAVSSVADRALGYGMPGLSIDGTDPLAVFGAVQDAADRARAGDGPTLIEANVVRITPHSSDDDDRRYRSDADREAARKNDPIVRYQHYLQGVGLLSPKEDERLRGEVRAEVDEAVAYAETAPLPDPATVLDHIYAAVKITNPLAQFRTERGGLRTE